ncbi:MAG: hypothetical protein V3W11_08580 [bacterium]
MKRIISDYWPLVAAVVSLWLAVGWLLVISLEGTDGHLVYALDDAYIHMAMAKNIALHGVWGVTRYGFSSTSSSPLWLLVLTACYYAFGVNGATPFILNVLFATAVCAVAFVVLKKTGVGKIRLFVCLFAITFLTPLPTLIFSGMEHTMHTFLAVAFLYASTSALAKSTPAGKDYAAVIGLSLLVILARYEDIFLVAVVAALLLFKKKLPAAFLVLAAGALPLIVLGFISMSKGWYFLPNSILLNIDRFGAHGLSYKTVLNLSGFGKVARAQHILMLILGSLAAFSFAVKKYRHIWHPAVIMPAVFVAAAFLHMQYCRTGHFYRYEAYLVTLGLVTLGAALPAAVLKTVRTELKRASLAYYSAVALLLAFAAWPLCTRAYNAYRETPRATANIYEQQYQMGLFLKEFYTGEVVAANDIGAINYLADIKCLDLVGLATMEVVEAKVLRRYDTREIAALAEARGAAIAILYKHWYTSEGGLPPEWPIIGSWRITGNVVCAHPEVQFYAIAADEQFELLHNLVDFSERLPETVEQGGPIVGPAGRSYHARRSAPPVNPRPR